MKIDPYKHKERYYKWKEKVKTGIKKLNDDESMPILMWLYRDEK